jgi:hypothetical protein
MVLEEQIYHWKQIVVLLQQFLNLQCLLLYGDDGAFSG